MLDVGRALCNARRQARPLDASGQAGAADAALKTANWQRVATYVIFAVFDQGRHFLQAAVFVGIITDQQKNAVFERRGVLAHFAMHALQPARVGDVIANDKGALAHAQNGTASGAVVAALTVVAAAPVCTSAAVRSEPASESFLRSRSARGSH